MAEWIAFGDAALQFLLLNWAVQATGVLGAGVLLSHLPRLKPAARHGVLTASLLLALAAPAFTVGRWALAPSPTAHPTAAHQTVHTLTPAVRPSLRTPASQRPTPNAQRLNPNAPRPSPALPPTTGYLLALALAGVAVVRLVWLACGIWSVRRVVRRARPVDHQRLEAACGHCLTGIPVLESDDIAVPSVSGVRRPRILVPTGLPETLEPKRLRDVLFHEEAHARRRDPFFLCVTAFCHAWLFWHPLAALVRRRMETAAEDACDAFVLSRGVDPAGYARTLLHVLERAVPAPRSAVTCLLGWAPAGMGAAAELRRRVTLILSGGVRTSPAVAALAALGMAGTASGLGLAHVGSAPHLPAFARPRRSAIRPVRLAPAPRAPRVARKLESTARRPEPTPAPARPAVRTAFAAVPAGLVPELHLEHTMVAAPILTPARLSPPRAGRCVVYLLDVSGSMRPHQAEARRQLLELAQRLSPGDTFNVLAFAGEVTPFALQPLAAAEGTLAGVEVWLEDLPEQSGTNLNAALQSALETPGLTRVVILSDGEAWRTPQGRTALVSLVERDNRCGAVIEEVVLGPADPPVELLLPHAPAPEPERRTLETEESLPLLP